ncbi:acyl-CoA dehydrogenase family protein [Streptomyces sp. NPDC021093]|uniref:acyl-CoA dehydrogenase family protein n=1 Tax=Streptomyces sp. NPDC021093 TaxID=3365112 RepID=UPI0037A67027
MAGATSVPERGTGDASGIGPEAARFARFAAEHAGDWDRRGEVPDDVRRALAATGLLGADVPAGYGGLGGSQADLGELCARIGGACSALRGLVTVQSMVAAALSRWGTEAQRTRWLPDLAAGRTIAGFAATEPGAGTDLAAVSTRIEEDGDWVRVTGTKRWVTFGRTADVFLVLGTSAGRPTTVLVDGALPGVSREPVEGQLGMRAAEIAHLRLDDVRVPRGNVVAPVGLGLSHVVATALDHGRFTVAWGCVGMAESCLDAAAAHVVRRTQGGIALAEHQLVRAQLARAAVESAAARELCAHATRLRTRRAPEAVAATITAKYAAARAAGSVSRAAVQLLGAAGCEPDSAVGRFSRDAQVMEIIEGSAHVAELHIADRLLRRHGFRPGASAATPSPTATPGPTATSAPAPAPAREFEETAP